MHPRLQPQCPARSGGPATHDRPRRGGRLRVALAGLAAVLLLGVLPAVHADEQLDMPAARHALDTIEDHGLNRLLSPRELRLYIKQIDQVRDQYSQCEKETQTDIGNVADSLKAIGPKVPGEPWQITHERSLLGLDKNRLQSQLAECRLLRLRSEEILTKIERRQRRLMASHILERDQPIWVLAVDNFRNLDRWRKDVRALLTLHSGLDLLTPAMLALALGLAIAGAGLGYWIRALVRARPPLEVTHDFHRRLLRAVVSAGAYYTPPLLFFGVLSLFLGNASPETEPLPFLTMMAYGGLGYTVLLLVIRALLRPDPPASQITPWPDEVARSMAQRLDLLALIGLLGSLLYVGPVPKQLAQEAYQFTLAVFTTVLTVNLMWLLWLAGRIPVFGHTSRAPRLVLMTFLAAVLAAECLGFHGLATYLLRGMLSTLLAGVLFWVVYNLLADLFTGLGQGRHPWQRRFRHWLGLRAGEATPGLGWLRFLAAATLWVGFVLLVLRLWGLSDAGLGVILGYLTRGFVIGPLQIVPTRVLVGLLLMAVLLTVSRWFQRKLDKRWLSHGRMEPGAREAFVTITGYAGFIVAVVVGLSVAGVDFSKLALIAGALSVGIGFGLQNIVNNFVSGIILLLERPIRPGDWIVVGGTEGYVKRVSVRSTEIQTFDKADVIVPNSELISSQVTNWTLHDPYGRVRIPIGVAYGSDTALVQRLLLGVARAHPEVVTDGRPETLPPPWVLFLSFGDSALNFELRCIIRNINNRLAVISDLNFAIDAAFREHGIEIPFPQRDIHVRDWPRPPAQAGTPDE